MRRAIRTVSKCPVAFRDENSDVPSGSNSYRMRLPAGIPAALYRAVTIYNVADGTMPAVISQRLPMRNTFDRLVGKDDGSVDIYVGPELSEPAQEKNRIDTVPGRDFFWILRLYGSGIEFFDQAWRPDDLFWLD